MSKKLITMVLLFSFSLAGFLYIQQEYGSDIQRSPFAQPTPTPITTTILSFSPSELLATPGVTTKTDILLQSLGTVPSLVQLEIAYDPLVLADIQIVPGDYFINPSILLNTINPNIGRISYAMQNNGTEISKDKKGILATLYFTPLQGLWQKDTSLYFLPKTSIKTSEGKNIFTAGYGVKISKPTFTPPIASQAAY